MINIENWLESLMVNYPSLLFFAGVIFIILLAIYLEIYGRNK